MQSRYFKVTSYPPLPNPQALFLSSLNKILHACPPTQPYPIKLNDRTHYGLFAGPTSLAFLFYTISIHLPTLLIPLTPESTPLSAAEISSLYLTTSTPAPPFDAYPSTVGITNEFLAHHALSACLSPSLTAFEGHVRAFLSTLPNFDDTVYTNLSSADLSWLHQGTGAANNEWMTGRAGALYLLRLMRRHLTTHSYSPESEEDEEKEGEGEKAGPPPPAEIRTNTFLTDIDAATKSLSDFILAQQPWLSMTMESLGAVHGSIGILTQLVLSTPALAAELAPLLTELLDLQDEEGNWPVRPGRDTGLVQFCHGAPGFIVCLLALTPFFRNVEGMEARIEEAIRRGRECVWEKGLLRKEPGLCHGVAGNAMCLEKERRGMFLGLCTDEEIERVAREGRITRSMDPWGLLVGEGGRAWCWLMCVVGKEGGWIGMTDV